MRVIYKDGIQIISTLNIKTSPLPESYPEIDLRVSNKVQMEKGLFFLSLGRSEGVKIIEALYSIVDEAGELDMAVLPEPMVSTTQLKGLEKRTYGNIY